MLTRLRVWLGWLAYRVDRALRRAPGPLRGPDQRLWILVTLLLGLAVVPFVIELSAPQPREVSVDQIRSGDVALGEWIRLDGDVLALPVVEDVVPPDHWTLQHGSDPADSIVLRASTDTEVGGGGQMVTGILEESELAADAGLSSVPNRIVALDPVASPRRIPNPLLWGVPVLLALALAAGSRIGYPIFDPGGELNVIAQPLMTNESRGTRVIGRIGARWCNIGDRQAAAVSVVEPPTGRRVLLSLIERAGRGAPHVLGEPSVEGSVGYVHSRDGSLPAILVVRRELEVILLFDRTADRDRLGAMMPRS
jgi:hypothetical protein